MDKSFYCNNNEIIERWIKKGNRTGYKKLSCSAYEGVMYTKADQETGRSVNFDICLPGEGIIFEAAFGINVISDLFMPSIELYCQEIEMKYGVINIDGITRNLYYHVESSLLENEISEETLDLFETEAFRLFKLHYDNLTNLACGKVISLKPIAICVSKKLKSINNFERHIDCLEEYLVNRSNHNAVCKKIDKTGNDLYCQVILDDTSYRLTLNINKEGILVVTGSYGENAFVVPEAYRYLVADYINRENSKHKYGAMFIGDKKTGVYCRACTSLLDGLVGEKTIEFLEHIVIKTLNDSIETITMLGSGLLPSVKRGKERTTEIAQILENDDSWNEIMDGIIDIPQTETLDDKLFGIQEGRKNYPVFYET